MTGAAAVEVEELRVAYGDRVAVDGVSFSRGAGEVVALLGPNGAGKTTTVETLEGYRRPRSGAVRVLGLDPIADHTGALVPRIGVVLQRRRRLPDHDARTRPEALRVVLRHPREPPPS